MTAPALPQAAPHLRIARFRSEIDAALGAFLDGPRYVLGPAVERFEAAFAAHEGRRHAVGVGSGTDAIALALRALGVGAGDEVIVPGLTFSGTAQAVLHAGARPIFADVDPVTRCLSAETAAEALTPRTAAIVPVHLFGQPADMPGLMRLARRHGLVVVADCAQSHGARIGERPLGSFGDAAAYSFYPTKNLGCLGDGGAVLTDDPRIADRLRALREYGFPGDERLSLMAGFNSRLDAIQASILSVLLARLDAGNAERRGCAERYRAALGGADGLRLPPDDPGAVYHQFAVTHPAREALAAHLAAAGIGTAVHYDPPLDRHPAFAAGRHAPLPVVRRLASRLLSLPIQPELAVGRTDAIAAAVIAACAAQRVPAAEAHGAWT